MKKIEIKTTTGGRCQNKKNLGSHSPKLSQTHCLKSKKNEKVCLHNPKPF